MCMVFKIKTEKLKKYLFNNNKSIVFNINNVFLMKNNYILPKKLVRRSLFCILQISLMPGLMEIISPSAFSLLQYVVFVELYEEK